ncbi:hypothetical protein [Aureimonas psammosilenae]|uniref:hypothetical protein n=1 Tax=Aureimonas psammosilenae TaxID=2495496 RepID=UPI001869A86C|nr:hypothetical protein [Aureimonas psammosilenae]
MIIRLMAVTTLIAVFALSFSAFLDSKRAAPSATPDQQARQDCLADGLLCAPGGVNQN